MKLCYICREEEQYDGTSSHLVGQTSDDQAALTDPPHPPVEWVHPCNCTLVAHEKCLLNWIQSSQEEPARKKKALKCPQCGTTYELESYNPPLLKFLNNLNASAAVAGKVVFACGVAGGVAACASGTWLWLLSCTLLLNVYQGCTSCLPPMEHTQYSSSLERRCKRISHYCALKLTGQDIGMIHYYQTTYRGGLGTPSPTSLLYLSHSCSHVRGIPPFL